jgi:hypothetical protein
MYYGEAGRNETVSHPPLGVDSDRTMRQKLEAPCSDRMKKLKPQFTASAAVNPHAGLAKKAA